VNSNSKIQMHREISPSVQYFFDFSFFKLK
jgi:hypothetical protein